MEIKFKCKHCGKDYSLDGIHQGKRFGCQQCGKPVVVPTITRKDMQSKSGLARGIKVDRGPGLKAPDEKPAVEKSMKSNLDKHDSGRISKAEQIRIEASAEPLSSDLGFADDHAPASPAVNMAEDAFSMDMQGYGPKRSYSHADWLYYLKKGGIVVGLIIVIVIILKSTGIMGGDDDMKNRPGPATPNTTKQHIGDSFTEDVIDNTLRDRQYDIQEFFNALPAISPTLKEIVRVNLPALQSCTHRNNASSAFLSGEIWSTPMAHQCTNAVQLVFEGAGGKTTAYFMRYQDAAKAAAEKPESKGVSIRYSHYDYYHDSMSKIYRMRSGNVYVEAAGSEAEVVMKTTIDAMRDSNTAMTANEAVKLILAGNRAPIQYIITNTALISSNVLADKKNLQGLMVSVYPDDELQISFDFIFPRKVQLDAEQKMLNDFQTKMQNEASTMANNISAEGLIPLKDSIVSAISRGTVINAGNVLCLAYNFPKGITAELAENADNLGALLDWLRSYILRK